MLQTRDYSVVFDNVAVSAVQDLIALYASGSGGVVLKGFQVGQVTSTGIVMLRWAVMRLPATVTAGSGGTSATPRKTLGGDAAAVTTARINDTTVATTSGTAELLAADVMNVVNGTGQIGFPRFPTIKANEAITLRLNTGPAALNMSGTVYFGEPF